MLALGTGYKKGTFYRGKLFAVPYRHHMRNSVFQVWVGHNEDENSDCINIRLVAKDAENAAEIAMKFYLNHLRQVQRKKKNLMERKNATREKREEGLTSARKKPILSKLVSERISGGNKKNPTDSGK